MYFYLKVSPECVGKKRRDAGGNSKSNDFLIKLLYSQRHSQIQKKGHIFDTLIQENVILEYHALNLVQIEKNAYRFFG